MINLKAHFCAACQKTCSETQIGKSAGRRRYGLVTFLAMAKLFAFKQCNTKTKNKNQKPFLKAYKPKISLPNIVPK